MVKSRRAIKVRNLFAERAVALLAVLAFSSVVVAQTPDARTPPAQQGGTSNLAELLSAKFFPGLAQNRAIPKNPEPAGPAPKRDLNGAWVGPLNRVLHGVPPMTPVGEARFKLNKPEAVVHLAATNDPYVYCDPLGFPRSI